MSSRPNRRAAQRRAFRAYIRSVKSVEETWTGWRKELVLDRQREESRKSKVPDGEQAGNSSK